MPSILVLNGPNLNLLGTRQPEVYGRVTLEMIDNDCTKYAASNGARVVFLQSNHEGDLIDAILAAKGTHQGIVSEVAPGQICGFGPRGYLMAIGALIAHLEERN